jgi:hypothetical protein
MIEEHNCQWTDCALPQGIDFYNSRQFGKIKGIIVD